MKKIVGLFLVLVFLVALSFLLEGEVEEDIIEEEEEVSLEEIVYSFLGSPYQGGPLGEGEGEKIYREDVFDCTTLVLISAANYNAKEVSPEEKMKDINYHPPGEVSYESRLHFSSYRNLVSPYFKDITREVGGENFREERVLLNGTRIIPIDWQEEIVISYIPKEKIHLVLENLPKEAGVGFIREGSFDIGLDINHEGFLFEGRRLVHASLEKGEVVEENFLDYLSKRDYKGVIFYKLN